MLDRLVLGEREASEALAQSALSQGLDRLVGVEESRALDERFVQDAFEERRHLERLEQLLVQLVVVRLDRDSLRGKVVRESRKVDSLNPVERVPNLGLVADQCEVVDDNKLLSDVSLSGASGLPASSSIRIAVKHDVLVRVAAARRPAARASSDQSRSRKLKLSQIPRSHPGERANGPFKKATGSPVPIHLPYRKISPGNLPVPVTGVTGEWDNMLCRTLRHADG